MVIMLMMPVMVLHFDSTISHGPYVQCQFLLPLTLPVWSGMAYVWPSGANID